MIQGRFVEVCGDKKKVVRDLDQESHVIMFLWCTAEVCIFFQGDRMNPILWAELDGQVEAMSSTFRISSSDPMRRRESRVWIGKNFWF